MNLRAAFATIALVSSSLVFYADSPAIGSGCTIGVDQKGVTAGLDGLAANSGSQSNPFPIRNANDLQDLDSCIALGKTANVFYQQVVDIDLGSNPQFLPLGQSSQGSFQGSYSAASSSASLELSFTQTLYSTSTLVRSGLFYSLSGAKIADLRFSVSMVVEADNINGNLQSGGLAARVTNSEIESVNALVDISSSASSTVTLGGLVGEADNTTFSDIVVSGSISSFHSRTINRFNFVGGLVGLVGGGHFSNISVIQRDSTSRVYATNLLTEGKPFVGGLIGDTRTSGQIEIEDVKVSIPIVVDYGNYPYVGGVLGRALSSTKISRAQVSSTIVSNAKGNSGSVGGIIGNVATGSTPGAVSQILNSEFSGHLVNRSPSTNFSSYAGGIAGEVGNNGVLIVSNSANVGAITSPSASQYIYAAGALGVLNGSGVASLSLSNFLDSPVVGSTIAASFYARPVLGRFIQGQFSGLAGTVLYDESSYFSSPLTQVTNEVAISRSNLIDSSKIPFDSYSSTVDLAAAWNQCGVPYLSWLSNDGCAPRVAGAILRDDGKEVEVFFTQQISPNSVDPSTLLIVTTTGNVSAVGQPLFTYGGRALAISLSRTVLANEHVYLNYSASSTVESLSGAQALARSFVFLNNPSTASGPVAEGLAAGNLTPDQIQITFSCGGSCDSAASYDYVASVTPAGGAAITQTGTTTGTSTLTFNNLAPNVAHVVSVTVTQGGLTSPAATLNITTPKPAATISAISVLDTSATLTVGCTNCGAAPDSFTVSATPVAGGAAVTSNTNVISGLSPETTYSFSVVVAFAGTTSDLVLWQDNPVMTLPLVPVISAVSPAAIPLTGGTITVTGSNFTTSSLLTLGGTSRTFTIVSGTEITFTAPSGTAGSFDLAITNPVGTFTLSTAITYVSGPSLISNSPVLATTYGGTIVTLTGTDLATTNQVNVGSTTVSFSVISNTVLRFTTAATTAGVVDVGVVTVGGAASISSALEFTTSALVPVISTITPVTGPSAGGTTITVTGQYFSGSYSDSVSAAINGVSGSSVILIDDSTLTFVSPAGAAATGLDVSVATGGGVGTLAGAFTYTAPPAPSSGGSGGPAIELNTPEILLFSTREIAASGGEVTATGRRLADISVLTLGGISVTIVSNTDTSVTFTTGEMPVGVWDLRLVGSSGTLTFQQAITVTEQAIVSESTGELLGWTWTLKFTGNSRSFSEAQQNNLRPRLTRFEDAETIVCWGYTTAANPNAWAIAHATQRAQAACDFALANQGNVKTVVRLRYGVSKDYAMRSALQFWK